MTGRRIGRLTITHRESTHGNGARWSCLCDCGNRVSSRGNALRSGQMKSCGCLRKDQPWSREKRDLTGAVYGWLTVIGCEKDAAGRRAWLCSCSCGRQTVIRTGLLSSGNTKSCGCGQHRHKNRFPRLAEEKFSGVYAIAYRTGVVKFGCATDVLKRLKQYHREVILGGGAAYFAAPSADRLNLERQLIAAAAGPFIRVSKEMFSGASPAAVRDLLASVTGIPSVELRSGAM